MNTITLNNPITIDSISISELTLRRPKVRDYLAIERIDGSDLNREVTLTANLASVTKLKNWILCQNTGSIKRFFSIAKELRLNVLLLSSITGGGIEQFLDMENRRVFIMGKS